MATNSIKKLTTNLTGHQFHRDIEVLSFLSSLNEYEVSLMHEVLSNSLKFDLADLIETMESPLHQLIPALEKFTKTGLLRFEGSKITVDKEMRKQYEFHIERLESNFKPDLEFIQTMLSKMPAHVLPIWYDLPRASDHFFSSIIEKFLHTPKIYERYLEELIKTYPLLKEIAQEILKGNSISVEAFQEKHQLTKAKLTEFLLALECYFVGYLGYRREDGAWKEVIFPFQEWKEFRLFCTKNQVTPIENVKIKGTKSFQFIEEMAQLLESSKPIKIKKLSENKEKAAQKLQQVGFAEIEKETLIATEEGIAWLSHSVEDRALILYRHPQNRLAIIAEERLYQEKTIREVEKSLRRVMGKDWVYLDNFLKGITAAIGKHEAVALKSKGKQWRYALPTYSADEQNFIEQVIFERLFQLGLVDIAVHQDKKCFRTTAFARIVIGE